MKQDIGSQLSQIDSMQQNLVNINNYGKAIEMFIKLFMKWYYNIFRRSCLGSLLTPGFNSVLANEKHCKQKGVPVNYLFENKLCD